MWPGLRPFITCFNGNHFEQKIAAYFVCVWVCGCGYMYTDGMLCTEVQTNYTKTQGNSLSVYFINSFRLFCKQGIDSGKYRDVSCV